MHTLVQAKCLLQSEKQIQQHVKNLLILLNLLLIVLTLSLYAKNSNWLRLRLIGLIGCASVEASCPHFQQY